MTYDELDQKILSLLRSNSRTGALDCARILGVPKSTVHERIAKLLRAGVRCTPLIDFGKLGYSVAVIFITPFQKELVEHPSVNTAQQISPNLLYLECYFTSFAELESFKEGLHAARFFHIVDTLKREGMLAK